MVGASKLSRQERVLEQVKSFTRRQMECGPVHLDGIDAAGLAAALTLDRANVSKELNLLYRVGQVIKFQGKPTRFLHRMLLAEAWPGYFLPTTVPKGSNLSDYLLHPASAPGPQAGEAAELETTIGALGSLRSAVEQAKAAICYPPRGLHTLITGSSGVGKIRFARMMYTFAIARGKLPPEAQFITFSCQDYAGSPQLLMSQLFGHGKGTIPGVEKGRRGLIEQAAGGILYLDGVQKLPNKVQDLLVTLLEKNTYSRMGEAAVTRYGDVMIIAASTEQPGSTSIERFVRSMPVHIPIPDLDSRGPEEILAHLVLFFSRESAATGVSFRIHKDILTCLVDAPCPGQIGELRSRVKIICSLAYLEYSSNTAPTGTMEISYRHLPSSVTGLLYGEGAWRPETKQLFSRFQQDTLLFTPGEPPVLPLMPKPQSEAAPPAGEEPPSADWSMESVDEYISRCMNSLPAGERLYPDGKSSISPALYEAVQRLLLAHEKYHALNRNSGLLYGFLLHLHNASRRQLQGLPPAAASGDASRAAPQEYAVACELRDLLSQATGITLPDAELDFIAMYLYLAVKWVSSSRVGLLAVFHGEGIAQGLAAYVNATYGLRLVCGISYGGTTTLDELLDQVVQAATEENQGAGILVFSDMEPLTQLHRHIYAITGLRAETISNAALPLMLDLAGRALRGCYSLQALAEEGERSAQSARENGAGTSGATFLGRIVDEVLSASLTFLNPRKAAETLLLVLDEVLKKLGLQYSDEIAVKFIFHCAHMLERVIRGDSLKYPGLKGFVDHNSALILLLEQQLSYAGEVFGVPIPVSELAYVAEIFLPFLPPC